MRKSQMSCECWRLQCASEVLVTGAPQAKLPHTVNEKLHAEAKPFELVGRRTGEEDVQHHTGAPHVRLLAVIHQAGQHLRARPGTILSFDKLPHCRLSKED